MMCLSVSELDFGDGSKGVCSLSAKSQVLFLHILTCALVESHPALRPGNTIQRCYI